VNPVQIPPELSEAVRGDAIPSRFRWLAGLPEQIEEIAAAWGLELGRPYIPSGQCAWVAPVRDRRGQELVLKVSWRHLEAEHEADGLRVWDGDGTVRCFASRSFGDSAALLLERAQPGVQLWSALPEPEQDVVVATLLRRLWEHRPPPGHPFRSLQTVCDYWADQAAGGSDAGPVREGIALLRELPRTAERSVLLATDLHAGNVLSSQREPWLAIDPKPFVGDPAYDTVQHMLNCERRLADDPFALAERMARLTDTDSERVRLWLFARCAQEAAGDPSAYKLAHRLASTLP
jgi:streptomycin 6-kinase